MIRTFRGRETEKLFRRERNRAVPPDLQRVALRKLARLDAAESLDDLRVPPGNRLEALRGDRRRTTTEDGMGKKILSPVHPGEILQMEFLEPLGMSQYRLAKGLRVPPRRINEIVHGERGISADTALRLARFFGTSERFWLNLQNRYDLEVERDRLGDALERDVEVLARAV